MGIPYAEATSGTKARGEILAILKRFDCEAVGFMDEFDTHTLVLAFKRKGAQVQLRASAGGWAKMYLKENPWHNRRKSTQDQWEEKALDQGMVAVNSILRDWIKGQITAIETGILSFENIFMPYMLTADGTPLIDQAKKLLLEHGGS